MDQLSCGLDAGEAAEYAQKSVKALGGMLGKDHPALESFWQAAAGLLQKVRLRKASVSVRKARNSCTSHALHPALFYTAHCTIHGIALLVYVRVDVQSTFPVLHQVFGFAAMFQTSIRLCRFLFIKIHVHLRQQLPESSATD